MHIETVCSVFGDVLLEAKLWVKTPDCKTLCYDGRAVSLQHFEWFTVTTSSEPGAVRLQHFEWFTVTTAF